MASAADLTFIDPISGATCEIIIEPGKPPKVKHPGCVVLADIALDLDAFYCRFCHMNGRVPGAWVISLLPLPA